MVFQILVLAHWSIQRTPSARTTRKSLGTSLALSITAPEDWLKMGQTSQLWALPQAIFVTKKIAFFMALKKSS